MLATPIATQPTRAARWTRCGPLGTEREAVCQRLSLEWPARDRFQDRWLLPAFYVVQDGQAFLSEALKEFQASIVWILFDSDNVSEI
jgi:hypothetical protein